MYSGTMNNPAPLPSRTLGDPQFRRARLHRNGRAGGVAQHARHRSNALSRPPFATSWPTSRRKASFATAHFGGTRSHGKGLPLLRRFPTAGRIQAADAERLRNEFSGLPTVQAQVERSSHVLMELTRNVGIAAAMPALLQQLDQIELVPLPTGAS